MRVGSIAVSAGPVQSHKPALPAVTAVVARVVAALAVLCRVSACVSRVSLAYELKVHARVQPLEPVGLFDASAANSNWSTLCAELLAIGLIALTGALLIKAVPACSAAQGLM